MVWARRPCPNPSGQPVPRLFPVALAVTALPGVALAAAVAAGAALPHVTASSPTGVDAERGSLVNGRLVNPPGQRSTLGDYPVNLMPSPDGGTAVVVNSGEGEGAPQQGNQSLQIIDVATAQVVQTVRDHEVGGPTFYNYGPAWSLTGGGNDQVYDDAVLGQRLSLCTGGRGRRSTRLLANVRAVAANSTRSPTSIE